VKRKGLWRIDRRGRVAGIVHREAAVIFGPRGRGLFGLTNRSGGVAIGGCAAVDSPAMPRRRRGVGAIGQAETLARLCRG
jgi:hypothetical protein